MEEICEENLYETPVVLVEGNPEEVCSYIPSHVWYILMELLKNACRVVIQAHGGKRNPLPPVIVSIWQGDGHVNIQVRDEGPGIPEPVRERIWSYMYTTEPKEKRQLEIAGCGVGLPLSRLYSEYFGGSLEASFGEEVTSTS